MIRRFFLIVLLGVAFGVVAANLIDPDREQRLSVLKQDHARMQSLIRRTEARNTHLQLEMEGLRTADGWRAVARRDSGMILEGEVVFRFPVEDGGY